MSESDDRLVESHMVSESARMADALRRFVRDIGLLEPGRTPCGTPLTVTQAHALAEVRSAPDITQRRLADTLGLAKASLSEVVADLVARGWLDQRPAAEDRRQRCLRLTAAGERVADEVAAARQGLMAGLLAQVDPAGRAELVRSLELLAATVGDYRDQPASR